MMSVDGRDKEGPQKNLRNTNLQGNLYLNVSPARGMRSRNLATWSQ